MADIFAPPQQIHLDPRTGVGPVDYAGPNADQRMWVRFHKKSIRNVHKSELEGRPIYEPRDYVSIQHPGERDVVVREVIEEHKQRWPRQWAQYQQDKQQSPDGTPVQMIFPTEPEKVDLCIDLRILTVEALATASEDAIHRLGMDGRRMVARAQAALEQAARMKEITRLEGELRQARDENQVLKDNMLQMQDRMAAMEARVQRMIGLEERQAMELPELRGGGSRSRRRAAEPMPEQPQPPRSDNIV